MIFGDPRFHVPAAPLFAIPVALSLRAVAQRVGDKAFTRAS